MSGVAIDTCDRCCQKPQGVFKFATGNIWPLVTIGSRAPSLCQNINPRITLNGFCIARFPDAGFAIARAA